MAFVLTAALMAPTEAFAHSSPLPSVPSSGIAPYSAQALQTSLAVGFRPGRVLKAIGRAAIIVIALWGASQEQGHPEVLLAAGPAVSRSGRGGSRIGGTTESPAEPEDRNLEPEPIPGAQAICLWMDALAYAEVAADKGNDMTVMGQLASHFAYETYGEFIENLSASGAPSGPMLFGPLEAEQARFRSTPPNAAYTPGEQRIIDQATNSVKGHDILDFLNQYPSIPSSRRAPLDVWPILMVNALEADDLSESVRKVTTGRAYMFWAAQVGENSSLAAETERLKLILTLTRSGHGDFVSEQVHLLGSDASHLLALAAFAAEAARKIGPHSAFRAWRYADYRRLLARHRMAIVWEEMGRGPVDFPEKYKQWLEARTYAAYRASPPQPYIMVTGHGKPRRWIRDGRTLDRYGFDFDRNVVTLNGDVVDKKVARFSIVLPGDVVGVRPHPRAAEPAAGSGQQSLFSSAGPLLFAAVADELGSRLIMPLAVAVLLATYVLFTSRWRIVQARRRSNVITLPVPSGWRNRQNRRNPVDALWQGIYHGIGGLWARTEYVIASNGGTYWWTAYRPRVAGRTIEANQRLRLLDETADRLPPNTPMDFRLMLGGRRLLLRLSVAGLSQTDLKELLDAGWEPIEIVDKQRAVVVLKRIAVPQPARSPHSRPFLVESA